jgi:hypothetical protein
MAKETELVPDCDVQHRFLSLVVEALVFASERRDGEKGKYRWINNISGDLGIDSI